MNSYYDKWNKIYRNYPLSSLGWELNRPGLILIEFIKKGLIKKGKMLDICCGDGTNSVYLAKNNFSVYASDISLKAIQYAKEKALQEKVQINLILQNFINLSFTNKIFDFVFDMGCFHHVQISDRTTFIESVKMVLKKNGLYMLTCFSDKNGSSWNHFSKTHLKQIFSEYFKLLEIRHYSSIEGDGIKRFFYTLLMKK